MLFNFGTEISVFSKICKWWRWGGGGTLRRRCCVSSFLNCYFSDRIYQNGVRHSFNFHFSLLISKKRSKNGVKTLVWMIAQFSNRPDSFQTIWTKVNRSKQCKNHTIWIWRICKYSSCLDVLQTKISLCTLIFSEVLSILGSYW